MGLTRSLDNHWIVRQCRHTDLKTTTIDPKAYINHRRAAEFTFFSTLLRFPSSADYLSVQLRCSSASFGKMPRIGPRLVATSALRWWLALTADVPAGSSKTA